MQLKQVLQKTGMPVMTFEGNQADAREFDENRAKRLIELFVTETLGLQKLVA